MGLHCSGPDAGDRAAPTCVDERGASVFRVPQHYRIAVGESREERHAALVRDQRVDALDDALRLVDPRD